MHAHASDPLLRFQEAFSRARVGETHDATAVALATADGRGRPAVRMVLLKGADEGGFTFFTNYHSRKGRELVENPFGALCFYWPTIGEQVRVEGPVRPLPPAESDAYFRSRPRDSQLGAWASNQSAEGERAALLRRFEDAEARFAGAEVERPAHWGGFRLVPERIEFWRAHPHRLHERTRYTRTPEGWRVSTLDP